VSVKPAAAAQAVVVGDVHRQRGHRPVERDPPVPVAVRRGLEADPGRAALPARLRSVLPLRLAVLPGSPPGRPGGTAFPRRSLLPRSPLSPGGPAPLPLADAALSPRPRFARRGPRRPPARPPPALRG